MDSAEEFWDKLREQTVAVLCCAVLCLVSRIPELGREQREENKGSLLIFFSEALCLEHSARSAASQCWKPLAFQHTLVRLANKLQSNFEFIFFFVLFFGKREESTESEEVALISRKSFFLFFLFFFFMLRSKCLSHRR